MEGGTFARVAIKKRFKSVRKHSTWTPPLLLPMIAWASAISRRAALLRRWLNFRLPSAYREVTPNPFPHWVMLLPYLERERTPQISSASCRAPERTHIYLATTLPSLIPVSGKKKRPSPGWNVLTGIEVLSYHRPKPSRCFLLFGKTRVFM